MIAEWLNETFHVFDYALLELCHQLAEFGHPFMTHLMHAISFSGEYGAWMAVLGAILMLFPKTRKTGVAMLGAIVIGALFVKGFLKDYVARPRPYEVVGSDYYMWWSMLGLKLDTGFAFPSGHVETAIGSLMAMCIMLPDGKGKKYVPFTVIYVALMSICRAYMMEHYPSDIVAGLIIGVGCCYASIAITNWFFKLFEKYKENIFCDFVLNFELSWLKGGKPKKNK